MNNTNNFLLIQYVYLYKALLLCLMYFKTFKYFCTFMLLGIHYSQDTTEVVGKYSLLQLKTFEN